MSNKFSSTTFSLRSFILLGGQSVQATVYCEFSYLDHNSEMQLSVGAANQIGYGFGYQPGLHRPMQCVNNIIFQGHVQRTSVLVPKYRTSLSLLMYSNRSLHSTPGFGGGFRRKLSRKICSSIGV